MKVCVTLRYEGVEYAYEQEFEAWDEFRGPMDAAEWMYTEGNYGCDCNKALFIARHCDEHFPDFSCGERIELVSLAAVSP